MSADGKTALDSLNWGASTGGAAGTAETTSTLGVDRSDSRTPPDLSRVWAAAINANKNFCILVSQTFKGGTRLGCLPQSANPFGAGESGFYIDSSGIGYTVFNGTRSTIQAPQFTRATFTAVDTTTAAWSNLGGTQYVVQGVVNITDGAGPVVIDMVSKTSTGATFNASAPFTGTVDLVIFTV